MQHGLIARRRGAVLILAALAMVVLMAVTALAVDYGYLLVVRTQLQSATDAAALAGAMELVDADALTGQGDMTDEITAARLAAIQYAAYHTAGGNPVTIDGNFLNAPDGDVVVGYLADPWDLNAELVTDGLQPANSVRVRIRRTAATGNPIGLFFARAFGVNSGDVSASATATLLSGIKGIRVTDSSGPAKLLPFSLSADYWDSVVNGTGGNDEWTYNAETGQVQPGPDGIPELILYPLDLFDGGTTEESNQEPCGNFGTVDIGSPNNSTADIARQIVHGINADDLDWHGGALTFDQDGHIYLNGDSGISAGMKDELASIIGQPRMIPLYESVSMPGNNAEYVIVRFAGIRIFDVKLTGQPSNRRVVVQPANVIDGATIPDPSGTSEFIYHPVMLVR